MRRAALFLLWLTACGFDKDVPGPDGGPVVMPNPTGVRCNGADMRLCIDFETPAVNDAFGASLLVQDIGGATRTIANAVEGAAQWQRSSTIHVLDNPRLDIPGALTIEMWTKPTIVPSKSGDQQVGLFDAHLQYEMNFEWDRRLECRIYDGGGDDKIDSVGMLTINEWHHVACTYDPVAGELRAYIDGKLSGCKPTNRVVAIDNRDGAAIGANIVNNVSYKNHFVGDLDNVHLYARAMSAQEICTAWGYGSCTSTCPPSGESESGFGPWPGPWH